MAIIRWCQGIKLSEAIMFAAKKGNGIKKPQDRIRLLPEDSFSAGFTWNGTPKQHEESVKIFRKIFW